MQEGNYSGPQVADLVNQILEKLPRVTDLDAAVEEVRQRLIMYGVLDNLSSELESARSIVERQFQDIEILHTHSVIRKRPKWYFGPKPSDLHWPRLRDYLLNVKEWPEGDVESINQASNEIVSLLENPSTRQFSCRGLVLGHVQSGKTANMTAVMAKALDAGYDTVIVLAGLTNKLRFQTQLRLYNDLVRRNQLNWQVLTPNEVDRDFRAPPQGGFLSHSDKAQLAVIKKNVSPLRELKKAVDRTLPIVLEGLRVLVIDDECDQASVNAARGELEMTSINQHIRELLSILPAVTYVGYTATPFANVLIDPYRADGQDLDDLYPRDFITALPRADSYFGTEKLFGRTPADPDDPSPEEEGLDMIRDVTEEEENLLQPPSMKDRAAFEPSTTESLETAILYFLACCAARHARGDGDKHMTMLVHTSAYVSAHEKVAALIQGWVEVNNAAILDRHSELGRRLGAIWGDEQGRLPSNITRAEKVSVDRVHEYLPAVLGALEFPIENGSSDDRIDYTGEAKTYIVVGGSILARGLTLEGLMVSYFLRTASQYDTLLQMGRWFGYRRGYEDLPRIWIPTQLKLRFRSLALVEQEIRDDIEQYRRQDLTPMEMAVRIRAIPGMAITAANKMRAARQCAVSYWGTHRQTFRFEHTDEELMRRNWAAGAELVSRADNLRLRDPEADKIGKKLWRRVPKSSIRRFIETYQVQKDHEDLRPQLLGSFLDKDDPRLSEWDVGVVESGRGAVSAEPLGTPGIVRMVNRARLTDVNGVSADIKALMSRRDLAFDCHDVAVGTDGWDDLKDRRLEVLGQIPLLLLYPIDRASTPQRPSKERVPLGASFDVLGFGIVFPGSVTEGGSFVSVELKPLSAEDIDRIAAEEAAQAEAAGVG